MKTDSKDFDCVEMMHHGALRIYEATKDLSVEEELAYWKARHVQALETLTPRTEECADGE